MRFAQSSAVYFNYSLPYAIRELAALGYDGIEFWGGRPHMYRHDLDAEMSQIRELVEETGMVVCNFIPAQFRYPSLLCSDNPRVRHESVEYIWDAIDNAIRMGAPSVSLCPGMVPWDRSVQCGWANLVRSFREIDEYCQEKPIHLLIEPAHRFETNLIATVEDCIRMLDTLKSPRFGILLDTGHCHVNGEEFETVVPLCAGRPLHIHVDDNDGTSDAHLLPGAATVDFAALRRALEVIGYDGYLSAELGQFYAMNPKAACQQTLDFFRSNFPSHQ